MEKKLNSHFLCRAEKIIEKDLIRQTQIENDNQHVS